MSEIEIPRFTKPLEVVRFINRLLGSITDVDSLLRILLDSSLSVTRAERGFILLHGDSGLEPRMGRNLDRSDLEADEFQVSRTVIRDVHERKTPRIVVDAGRTPELSESESVRVFCLRSILCVPILSEDRSRGVIYLDNRSQQGAFVLPDMELVGALAEQAAMALAQAELRDQRERQNRAARELTRSNRELDRYASILSHDLREPLRAMASWGDLLERRAGDVLDEACRGYLERIRSGARRMQAQLDALLELARVEFSGEPTRAVALDDVLEEALKNLESAVRGCGAVVEACPLPVVAARQAHMVQLFQNLLANALKFRSTRPPAVRIEAARRPDGWQILVSDNGIGMEPRLSEEIFQPFRRLHTSDEYPGQGIGLTVCRRIARLYQGDLRVERTGPDQGTVWAISFPDSPGPVEIAPRRD